MRLGTIQKIRGLMRSVALGNVLVNFPTHGPTALGISSNNGGFDRRFEPVTSMERGSGLCSRRVLINGALTRFYTSV